MNQGRSVAEALAAGVADAGGLLERITAGSYVVKAP
jgi:butyrate kinase